MEPPDGRCYAGLPGQMGRPYEILTCAAVALMPLPAFAQAGPVGSGRYIIVHSPHVQRDTVLLDTLTGKTW